MKGEEVHEGINYKLQARDENFEVAARELAFKSGTNLIE